ncbi:peptidase inhibitor family I36 protein [Streptomyces flaveolus]|uniref:peptidase inhibitor family I36 protein n=1 Tax=Streptomyces flaveolus TaxID=67297 RepID=UPI003329860B
MKKVAAVFASLALAGAGIAVTAPSANADACPSGAVCAYAAENWWGTGDKKYGNNENLTDFFNWTNAESIYNNGTSCNVYIYSGTNYGGVRYPLNRGTGWKSIRGSSIWHHAYSNKWYGC